MWSLSNNGLGKKILRVNNYEYQDFITNIGGHAEGHSHFLTAISSLQTPLIMPLLKRGFWWPHSLNSKPAYIV